MKQNTKNLITWGRHPSHGAWIKLHEFSKAKNAVRLKEGWTLEFHPAGEKPDAPDLLAALQLANAQLTTIRTVQRSGLTLPDVQAGLQAAILKAGGVL